jgi:hypothetical protein
MPSYSPIFTHLERLLAVLQDGLKAMHIPAALMTALASASWPGRAQVLHDTQVGEPLRDLTLSRLATRLVFSDQ